MTTMIRGGYRLMLPTGRMDTEGEYMVPTERFTGYSNVLRSGKMEMLPAFPIDREMVVKVVAAFRFGIF